MKRVCRKGLRHDDQFKISSSKVLRTTAVFDIYWRFACERQAIFFKRLAGDPGPWTNDPVLQKFRFTNAYRASDRVSQYLIQNVIYRGSQDEEETFFRILLFKLFNRIDTWEALEDRLGDITWRNFDFARYDAILSRIMSSGSRLYSAAYIMPSPRFGAVRKHTNHLRLLSTMMKDGLPGKIGAAKSLRDVFHLLRSCPSLGDFLSFQFAIDLNYSGMLNFSEMDFVVAGPGAVSGIRKSFHDTSGLSDEEVIRAVTEYADREFERRQLAFTSLWGRPLQLIDCQNLFCEVDKYSRVALPDFIGDGRMRIKRRFSASSIPAAQFYPAKWGLVGLPAHAPKR